MCEKLKKIKLSAHRLHDTFPVSFLPLSLCSGPWRRECKAPGLPSSAFRFAFPSHLRPVRRAKSVREGSFSVAFKTHHKGLYQRIDLQKFFKLTEKMLLLKHKIKKNKEIASLFYKLSH